MKTAIVIFFLLLALTAIASVAFFYWQYLHWPPTQWKSRLHAHLDGLRRAIADQENDPDSKREAVLRDSKLNAYLDGIPLSRLADFPGIGPGTVQKLEEARFTRVSQMWQLGWTSQVPGIGDVREKALKDAARNIKIAAETEFDNGQCDEGRAWLVERDRLREGHRAESEKRDRIKAAANRAIRESQSLVDLAKAVTFQAFLFHKTETPITADVIARPFPAMVVDPPKAIPLPPPPPVAIAISPPPPTAAPLPLDDPALERLRSFCRFGFVIARADGRVAVAEKKLIREFLVDQFGGDARLVRHIDPVIEQCENPPPAEADVVEELKSCTDADERQSLLTYARRIADAVGDRNQKEQALLDRIAAAFGLGGDTPPTSQAAPATDSREILGIPAKVPLTAELVRRRWNIVNDQYDPAKAATLGPELAALAEQKRSAVRQAAEALLAQLGEPLVAPPPPPPPPPPADPRHNPDLDAVFGS